MRIQLTALLLGAYSCAGMAASDRELCSRLAAFADAVPFGKTHEITIQTDWAAEPKIGCTRDDLAAGKEICGWLPLNFSIEFMQGNISRAVGCFANGTRMDSGEIGFLAGRFRIEQPRLVKKKVWVEIEFSTSATPGRLPFLTIRSGHRD